MALKKMKKLAQGVPLEARGSAARFGMRRATPKPAGPTAFQKFAMKPSVGKILDSGKARKAAIPLGNAVIKGAKKAGSIAAKPFKWMGGQIEKEMRMDKAKDDKYRKDGEEYRNNPDNYNTSARRKGRSSSNGYMV